MLVGGPAELEGQSGQGECEEGGDQVNGVDHGQDQQQPADNTMAKAGHQCEGINLNVLRPQF